MKSTQKIFFPWAIAISAVALIVSIVALGVNIYNARYNTSQVQSGVSSVMKYTSGKTVNNMDMTPAKGTLYAGAKQDSGKSGTKYLVKYKKSSSASYTAPYRLTFNKNGVYSSSMKLTKTNGSTKYNFQLLKENNVSTSSQVSCDLFLK